MRGNLTKNRLVDMIITLTYGTLCCLGVPSTAKSRLPQSVKALLASPSFQTELKPNPAGENFVLRQELLLFFFSNCPSST